MFGSASRGVEGYNEKLSNYARERTVADNAAQSRRQSVEANTDSQVGRKQEWSRGIGAVPIVGPPADIIREGISGIVSSASDGKHGALPLTLRQRGYDGARAEYVNAANQNVTKYASDVNQANRETGDRMASISMQQGKASAGAAYAGAGTSIAGHRTAQSLNDQATRVEFTGRISGAEINQKAAIDTAKLQAISTIISRMGAKLAQDIEKGMEMRY
jgi:hypothetical protein